MKRLSLKQAEAQAFNIRPGATAVEMRVLTFKRDRGVRLLVGPDGYRLEEHGYVDRTEQADGHAAFKKAVKEAFHREFPRSHEVYVEVLTGSDLTP